MAKKTPPKFRMRTLSPCLSKSGPQTYRVKVSEILYLEKSGNYITVYRKAEISIDTTENLGDIFDLLPPDEYLYVCINHTLWASGILA